MRCTALTPNSSPWFGPARPSGVFDPAWFAPSALRVSPSKAGRMRAQPHGHGEGNQSNYNDYFVLSADVILDRFC
jgi:hypothetical protein